MNSAVISVTTDSFEHYMSQVHRFPLLSREEERQLALRYHREDDLEAAHTLICANLRFVVKVANEYRNYGIKLLDLVQEGNIGLMMAVKKFDPDRGIRLISYAVWWIRAYIQNFVIRSWSLVRIGTTQAQRKLFFKLGQARQAIERLGGSSDAEALAQELTVRADEVDEMTVRLAGHDAFLDLELTEGDDYSLLDSLADQRQSQEELMIEKESESRLSAQVGKALAVLNQRERHIVQDRILADDPRTLQELADDYGISRERVRQLEKQALGKLKGVLTEA